MFDVDEPKAAGSVGANTAVSEWVPDPSWLTWLSPTVVGCSWLLSAWQGRAASDQHRREPLHPAIDGDAIHLDAPLGQQLFHVPIGQAIAEVPADRHHDHIRREPEPHEPRPRRTYSTRTTTHQHSLPDLVTLYRARTRCKAEDQVFLWPT